MTRVAISAESFPSFSTSVRAYWAPVFLSPIRGSPERLVIGVAAFNDASFHIESANALHKMRCMYGSQAEIITQVAAIALDDLLTDFASRGQQAIRKFRPVITGISIGEVNEAEGISLQSIGAFWMQSISSLYENGAGNALSDQGDLEDVFAASYESSNGSDQLPKLVMDYIVEKRSGLRRYFRSDLVGKQRRAKSHEITIDFAGSKLVANFGTLKAGQVSRSVGIIKRRLWDLKVERDSETTNAFRRRHEMLIQMPSKNDPQTSDRQFESANIARLALEQQADQEDLRLEVFDSVALIGARILEIEAPN